MKNSVVFLWLEWHFVDMPKEIFKAWKNILLFNLRFFSVFFLIKTFFSYWHKYRWSYGRGFDIKRYLEAFFSNLVSRIIGATIRSIFIVLGILTEIVIFISGIIILILWVLLPILSVVGFITGIGLIFYGG